jgi:hypothetical protein
VNRSRQYHRYFTLYDVASLATFDSSEYVDLLEHPTPWSASMRPDFSNILRAICTVITAVLMIAERASDLILGQESVPQAETAEALP